ncbi:unnamed protein product [Arabis nemorensis]|uniref:Glutathione peroxidase n=1 Tax=Arabis nemorensis TaxID=586526 RepID=A0A565BUL2_9BRAS|nr:unnamed protein product [Arabis nemorensis]
MMKKKLKAVDVDVVGKESILELGITKVFQIDGKLFLDAQGSDVDLSTYKEKLLLIVTVASQCGLTNSNYTELAQLYQKYKNHGFEILAFPCNQFGNQEPGSNEEIVAFACTRFKAEYPIFDKVDVNGDKAAPIYKFLKSSKDGLREVECRLADFTKISLCNLFEFFST